MFSEIDLPARLRNVTVPEQELFEAQRQGLLLVALEGNAKPVGLALTQEVGSNLHILVLDVYPNSQRQGIGSALLKKIVELARNRSCRAVTLTTNRHVPWNAPWYEMLGFRMLPDNVISEHLRINLHQV